MAVTKLVERCFISDLALVSSPEVACGFRNDSNHRIHREAVDGDISSPLWTVLHSTLCQQKAIPPQSNENSHNIMWSTSNYGPNRSTLQFMRRVLREGGGQWAILETDSEISLQTIINIVCF